AQLISFIVVCVLGGITYVGLEPRLSVETDIRTFNGMETVHRWTLPNIWIGPSEAEMIKYGAMYAPCMRPDIEIQFMFTQQNYSQYNTLGCCEITSRNVAGTTTEEECHMHTQGVGQWRSGVPCSERSGGELSVRHMLRPCCVGIKGQCQLLSHKHCMFLGGIFHQFGPEHCSQVNCLSKVCQFGGMEASIEQPWLPQAPYQWWRILLSLLYHHGITLVAFVVMAQFIVLRQIEHNAGWLRMIIIYASASFNPHHSHVGGVGAVCGMLGVLFVELLQFWSLVQKPWMEVAKLTVSIVLILFLGTLPYLEIMGVLAGLVTGALCGVIVLPYITFGRWGTHARVVLIIVAVGLLFIEFSLLAHLFVNVQTLKSCGVCRLLNCVPYTNNMCNVELWED
ncbi:RHDF1-like protein, partial [Mya arenaria]